MEKDRLKKIAVIGAESTGKTWLCEALATHYKTAWVPEYARDYFNDSDIYNYTLNDLEQIAKQQLELEKHHAGKAFRYLFCDTTLITLKIWAELEFNTVPPFISSHIGQVHYDHYFITANDIAWQADPLRQNKHSRDLLFRMNELEARRSGVPYSVVNGEEALRLENAICAIEALPHLQ